MEAEATGPDRGRAAASSACAADDRRPVEKSAADLVVGADGRHSVVRERAGLAVDDLGAPMDVLWFRSRAPAGRSRASRSAASMRGSIFVMLDRGDYWQCAYVIPKGGFDAVRGARASTRSASAIAAMLPCLRRPRRRAARAGTTSSC